MSGGRFQPAPDGRGGFWQAAIPKRAPTDPSRANGLVLRGVVLQRYTYDTPAQASSSGGEPTGQRRAVYCDVQVYSRIRGLHGMVVPRVLVTQARGSPHEGEIGGPRPAKASMIGGTLDPDTGTSPADMDGSHVLVGFYDDDLSKPFLMAYLPHPRAGSGATDTADLVARLRLQDADGDPWFHKHRGSMVGLDDKGSWVIDLRRAHDGVLSAEGGERPQADRPDGERLDGSGDAIAGNFKVQLPAKAKITLEFTGGRKIELTDRDGKLVLSADKVDVGAGASEAAVQGTAWGAARAAAHATLIAQMRLLATEFAALSAPPGNPLAPLAALAAKFTAMAGALSTFEGGDAGDAGKYLSADVKVR